MKYPGLSTIHTLAYFLISLFAKLQLIYTASFLLHQHGSFIAQKAGVHWNMS